MMGLLGPGVVDGHTAADAVRGQVPGQTSPEREFVPTTGWIPPQQTSGALKKRFVMVIMLPALP